MSALVAKKPPSVDRATGPWRCWKSNATGGPPTDDAVPNTFEKKPAATDEPAVTGIGGDTTLRATPDNVTVPTTTASCDASTSPTIANPSSVPGTAPSSIPRHAGPSTARRSRTTVDTASGNAPSTIVAGKASGITSATNGAPSR